MAEKFIQKANASMERRGTKGSFGPATSKNIARGLKAGGKMAKKASFAKAMRTIANRRKSKSRSSYGR